MEIEPLEEMAMLRPVKLRIAKEMVHLLPKEKPEDSDQAVPVIKAISIPMPDDPDGAKYAEGEASTRCQIYYFFDGSELLADILAGAAGGIYAVEDLYPDCVGIAALAVAINIRAQELVEFVQTNAPLAPKPI